MSVVDGVTGEAMAQRMDPAEVAYAAALERHVFVRSRRGHGWWDSVRLRRRFAHDYDQDL
jgi:hypothetical protein